MSMPRVLGVIPARLGAERLPNKPLRLLGGRTLIERVACNARDAGVLDAVVVATDAAEVAAAARSAGFDVAMTRADHVSGTSRVAEVAARPAYADFDVVVNVQGDEPFLPARAMQGSVDQVLAGADIGTAAVPLAAAHAGSPHVVKVVMDTRGRALYFSRSAIPFARDGAPARHWQHLGVYAFRSAVLQRLVLLPAGELEQAEKLEQLRALANGMTIGVAVLEGAALPGIDTMEDLERAEAYLAAHGGTFKASEA